MVLSSGPPGGLPGARGRPLFQQCPSGGAAQRDSNDTSHHAGHPALSSECRLPRTGLAAAQSISTSCKGLGPQPCRHLRPPGPRELGLGTPKRLLSMRTVAGSAPASLHLVEASGRQGLPRVHLLPPRLPSYPDTAQRQILRARLRDQDTEAPAGRRGRDAAWGQAVPCHPLQREIQSTHADRQTAEHSLWPR